MHKLTPEQRLQLRRLIRTQLEEKGELKRGMQARLAEWYKVSKPYVSQIVIDERKRLKNPVAWEADKARNRGERINILELIERLKDHPALRQKPEN